MVARTALDAAAPVKLLIAVPDDAVPNEVIIDVVAPLAANAPAVPIVALAKVV